MQRSAGHAAAAALACVLSLALLVLLAYGVEPLQTADARALSWFAAYEHTALGTLATVITFFVDPVPLLIIVALLCTYGVRQGRLTEAAAALVTVAGANVTTQVAKHALAHARFQDFFENQPDLTTFPSGHVTGATSLVLAIAWVAPAARRRQALEWGALFVVAVSLSVLVLEWHFPSDALGGILVGLAWGFGVLAVYRSLPPRLRRLGRPRTASASSARRAAASTK